MKKRTRKTISSLFALSFVGILASCASNNVVVPTTTQGSTTTTPISTNSNTTDISTTKTALPAVVNANEYIEEYKDSVSDEFRNTYHLMAPIGWINDPNGFSEYKGKYNLFYQYNPYSAEWGPMHWGHQTTTDFIKWNLEDVALAPDMPYEPTGCFSGTAIVEGDRLYVAYTAASDHQNQALAYSDDGIIFNKFDELLIDGSKLPEGCSNNDFRDPKIFKRNNKYYIICGNRSTNSKHLIMFKSDNIEGPYTYCGIVYNKNDIGGILECPDLIEMGGKDVLIASPQGIRDEAFYNYQNADSCVYLVGSLSTNTNKFYKDSQTDLEEFDKGFSFYAPQTLKTSDGRNIMVAWMRSWAEPNITKHLGWCGAMTLPRELTLKDNHIYQAPVREINNYLKNKKTNFDAELTNNSLDLAEFNSVTSKISLEIDVTDLNNGRAGLELYKDSTNKTKLYYDKEKGCVVIDRTNCGSLMDGIRYAKVEPVNGKISLEIFLDVNSLEVFINGGYYTMTANIYAPEGANGVTLYSNGGTAKFSKLEKYEIEVQ